MSTSKLAVRVVLGSLGVIEGGGDDLGYTDCEVLLLNADQPG